MMLIALSRRRVLASMAIVGGIIGAFGALATGCSIDAVDYVGKRCDSTCPNDLVCVSGQCRLGATAAVSPDASTTVDGDSSMTTDAALDDYARVVLEDSPIGYWRLEERAGATFVNERGGAPAQLVGSGCALGVGGVTASGVGVDLVGTCAIEMGNVYAFGAKVPYSLEAWIKVTSLSGSVNWIFSRGTRDAERTGYQLWFNDASTTFNRRLGGQPDGEARATPPLSPNTFHHVVGTYDGQTNRLFIDGSLAATAPASQPLPAGSDGTFLVGDTANGLGTRQGTFDEIAVYDKTLSPERIGVHFNAATRR